MDSAVNWASRSIYKYGQLRMGVFRWLAGTRDVFLLQNVQTIPEALPASSSIGALDYFFRDRSMKIVRNFDQVFEPYLMMFKDMMKKKEAAPMTVFLLRKEKHYKIQHCLGEGAVNYLQIFAFSRGWGYWNLTPTESEG